MNDCSKCGGKMAEGFTADYSFGEVRQGEWVEGEPVKSFWSGTDVSYKKRLEIRTYRCENCGFLESYATEEKKKTPLADMFR